MILDNKNTNLKVHEWIAKYTKEGNISLVTGYFTIGALAYLSDKINKKLEQLIVCWVISFTQKMLISAPSIC